MKTKYTPDMCEKAERFAEEGMIDKEIAQKLGISTVTYYEYQNRYPEFMEAIKRGKTIVDDEVEQILLKRCRGYSFKEKKVIIEMDANGNQKPARIETVDKEIAPSDTALIFWLKNRRPDKWRDTRKIDFEESAEVKIDIHPASNYKNSGDDIED